MKRKRFSEAEVIETLAHQGTFIACYRCRNYFFARDNQTGLIRRIKKIEREHLHEIEFGGPDTPANCRYSCSECHAIITNGTKATSAGSSKQRIAKVRRLSNPKPSKRPMKSGPTKWPKRKLGGRHDLAKA